MYKFYLEKVKVPTPGKLEIKVKGANKVIRLANDGEMNLIRQPGLTEFRFDILLPMIVAEKSPDYYLKHLEDLMASGKPFRFIVNRTDGHTKELFSENLKLVGNTAVTLESFDVIEDANNGDDIEVGIVLKRYVHYATKEVTLQIVERPVQKKEPELIVQTVKPPFQPRPSGYEPAPPTEPIVSTGGDTVHNMARKYGVPPAQVQTIENVNKNEIPAGDKVRIVKSSDDRRHSGSGGSYNAVSMKEDSFEGSSGVHHSGSEGGYATGSVKKTTALGQAMKNLRKSGKYRGNR